MKAAGLFVIIDETCASTNIVRRFGRRPKGQRLISAFPHGHWKTTTFVAALRHKGLTVWLMQRAEIVLLALRDVRTKRSPEGRLHLPNRRKMAETVG